MAVRSWAVTGVVTGLALGAAGLVTVGAGGPGAPGSPAVAPAVELAAVDFDDLANVPVNLMYALLNAPANFFTALQDFANAQFFSGSWLVPSATNVWGIDLGDVPRIQALVDMLVPFPALSKPLGEQLTGYLAAEIPSNPDCIDISCMLSPQLLGNYFQVPTSALTAGYTFPESGPGVVDPHGAVTGAFGFAGTHQAPDGSDVYPWAGSTFTLDLEKPFEAFWQSLTAPPPDDPFVEFPNIVKVITDFIQSWLVMVNPFAPGGPYLGPLLSDGFADPGAAVGPPDDLAG